MPQAASTLVNLLIDASLRQRGDLPLDCGLERFSREAVPALIRGLKAEDPLARAHVAILLGRIGPVAKPDEIRFAEALPKRSRP